MIKRLARFIRGQRPSLLEAEKANEIIDCLNSLQNIQIVEGTETKATIHNNGITLSVRIPREKEERAVNIVTEYPLMSKVLKDGTIQLWVEGYTKNIRYCGGYGNLMHLAEPYSSLDVNIEDIDDEGSTTQGANPPSPTGISPAPAPTQI